MRPNNYCPKNEEGGVLVVTGTDHVKIPLLGHPHKVKINFKKKDAPAPCDPQPHDHNYDMLEWEIHRKCFFFFFETFHLVIRWDVRDIREIVWSVDY